jgi:hypothetical protein
LRDLGVRTIATACVCRATLARRVGLSICTISTDARAALRSASFVPHERWHEASSIRDFRLGDFHGGSRGHARCSDVELRRRQAELRSVRIEFEHVRCEPTFESFDWAEPTHERDRLLSLLRDRLERIVLSAPAIALRLTTGFLLPLQAKAGDLFDKAPVETLSHVLLERLRGRLGADAVHGIVAVAEHRPNSVVEVGGALHGPARQRLRRRGRIRPLWLLPVPLPLNRGSAAHTEARWLTRARSASKRVVGRPMRRDYYAGAELVRRAALDLSRSTQLRWYARSVYDAVPFLRQ